MSSRRVIALLAAAIVFFSTAALWPRQENLEEKFLAKLDQEMGLVPRFLGAKPVLPCDRKENTALPVLCPDAKPRALTPEELSDEAAEVWSAGNPRLSMFRDLLREDRPKARVKIQRQMESRLEKNKNSPTLLNDLAVIHLIRAGKGEEPEGYAEAFDLLNRAIEASPSPSPEIIFNRIYTLTSLGLRHQARESSSLLSLTKSWTNLTLGLLNSTITTTYGDSRSQQRNAAEQLLGRWGIAELSGSKVDAAHLLHSAQAASKRIAVQTGDDLLEEAIAAILQSPASLREQLAKGHAAFFQARSDHIYSDCSRLIDLKATEDLLATNSPFSAWAQLDQAICAYFRRDFSAANSIFIQIEQNYSTRKSYHALWARVYWIQGLVQTDQGRFAQANDSLQRSASEFRTLGELDHQLNVTSLIARNLAKAGNRREAWKFRIPPLGNLSAIMSLQRRYDALEEAALACRAENRLPLSLALTSERLALLESKARGNAPADLAGFISVAMAELQLLLNQRESSKVSLDRADYYWRLLDPSNESWNRLRLDIDLARAQLAGASSPAVLKEIDRSLRFFSGPTGTNGDGLHLLRLLALRAGWNSRTGHLDAAKADFEAGLREIDRQGAGTASTTRKAEFIASKRKFVEAKVRFEIEHGDHLAALLSLEANGPLSASRGTLAPRSTFDIKRFIEDLPKSVEILRYGVLDDQVLIWKIKARHLEVATIRISRERLRALADACRSSASNARPEDFQNNCKDLAAIVFPFEFSSYDFRWIVPDQDLWGVPYGALIPPGQESMALELSNIVYYPQLPLRLSLKLAGGSIHNHGPPLVVLNPTTDPRLFPELPSLSHKVEGKADYESLFKKPTILTEEAATKGLVLEALNKASIFQYSGHSFADSLTDGLTVAAATGSSGPLGSESYLITPTDILNLRLSKLDLAVLSACTTARTFATDFVASPALAEAFLMAGTRQVVATSWPVPSQSASTFALRLHNLRCSGSSIFAAIHQAQLDFRVSQNSDFRRTTAWAGYQLFTDNLTLDQSATEYQCQPQLSAGHSASLSSYPSSSRQAAHLITKPR